MVIVQLNSKFSWVESDKKRDGRVTAITCQYLMFLFLFSLPFFVGYFYFFSVFLFRSLFSDLLHLFFFLSSFVVFMHSFFVLLASSVLSCCHVFTFTGKF